MVGRVKRRDQPQKGRQSDLANTALNSGYLHWGEAGFVSQFFLGPALRVSRCPDVGAEALDRSIHESDRLGG